MTELEVGSFKLAVDPGETARQYRALLPYAGADVGTRLFLSCMCRAPEEATAFLTSLGIDPEKIASARPLAEPDEKGEVLFFAAARLVGEMRCPESSPRRSEPCAGMNLVFTGDHSAFHRDLLDLPEPQLEVRFVISLPFDPAFFTA